MVVPFNIIRAKRVFGPESGISLKASSKKTFQSPPQDDRRICMRTGKWAFRLGPPRRKFSGPLSGQPHVFKDCGTATGSLETACKERRQTFENRRSGLFNPGCGSKTMKPRSWRFQNGSKTMKPRSWRFQNHEAAFLAVNRQDKKVRIADSDAWLIFCLPVRPRGPGTMFGFGRILSRIQILRSIW